MFFLLTVIVTAFSTYFIVEYIRCRDDFNLNVYNTELAISRQQELVFDAYKRGQYDITLHELDKFNLLLKDSPYIAALPEKQVVLYKLLIAVLEYKVKKQQLGMDSNELKIAYDKMLSNMSTYNAYFSSTSAKNNVVPDNIDKFIDIFMAKGNHMDSVTK